MTGLHIPVLLTEAIAGLQVRPEAWYIDATFGRGGHTRQILKKGGRVVAFDFDQQAIEFGQTEFSQEIVSGQLILIRENFDQVNRVFQSGILANRPELQTIQGVLFDFGTSSNQLMDPERGFSFFGDAELDMRMDDRLGVKAKDLVAALPERQLTQLFIEYGGEHEAKKIARSIVFHRRTRPIHTVSQLVELIEQTKRAKRGHLHPATKVFQALRIAVNSELQSIELALPAILPVLASGGRVVTISFHEGEDRVVKHLFKKWQTANKGEMINKDVVVPSEAEVRQNPRSRSAKLRIFQKA